MSLTVWQLTRVDNDRGVEFTKYGWQNYVLQFHASTADGCLKLLQEHDKNGMCADVEWCPSIEVADFLSVLKNAGQYHDKRNEQIYYLSAIKYE
jgi:hypothetical protein